ncbi:hypothetical protein OPV22_019359 [Ensete ventricosum]|uniref:ER lumen protein-retaining receptor n=1 Tax=Ensete ventricosum TaxID=4639 RepID=A0AAV8QBR3_ENSVE|nr:hypothetical protein OPV22_019359 [Ensete ventricosum]
MNIFRLAGNVTHLTSGVLVLLLKIHTIKSCAGISLKTQELYALVFATRYLDIFIDFVLVVDILPIFGSNCILPQLVLLQRNIDNLTVQYVFLLGAYRAFYILNWIYGYFTEPHYVHWITWISGLAQTLIYADFFYYYFNSR